MKKCAMPDKVTAICNGVKPSIKPITNPIGNNHKSMELKIAIEKHGLPARPC